MLCINCNSASTGVTNSRPSKKTPSVWRRRSCTKCGYTFTTREIIAQEDALLIDGSVFSPIRLTFAIHRHLIPDNDSRDTAYWLAQTVQEQLHAAGGREHTTSALTSITYTVIKHYNPRAGLAYGLQHGLIEATATARRGRPKLKRN